MNIVSSTKSLMSAALFGSLLALPASAETFDFTTYSDGSQDVLTQSLPGLTVNVTAGFYAFDNSSGLIADFVTSALDFEVSTRDATPGDAGLGVVLGGLPNLGPDINGPGDLLTFSFDKLVRFDDVIFGNVDGGDNVDIFVDGLLVGQDSSLAGSNPYDLSGLRGNQISFGADRFTFFRGSDDFNVQALTATVPLPAGVILLATGIGGLFAARRRKTS